jgi:hypothetical protein
MSKSRKKYDAPVAYLLCMGDSFIYVSNKYTSILMYELWTQKIIESKLSTKISMYAIMPPTPWPTWSRTHIIALLNGCWKKVRIAYGVYDFGQPVTLIDKTKSVFRADNYEQHVKVLHSKMTTTERVALHNTLLYPSVLELVLRSPSPLAAKTALMIEKIETFPDGSSATKYISSVWKYLKYESKK